MAQIEKIIIEEYAIRETRGNVGSSSYKEVYYSIEEDLPRVKISVDSLEILEENLLKRSYIKEHSMGLNYPRVEKLIKFSNLPNTPEAEPLHLYTRTMEMVYALLTKNTYQARTSFYNERAQEGTDILTNLNMLCTSFRGLIEKDNEFSYIYKLLLENIIYITKTIIINSEDVFGLCLLFAENGYFIDDSLYQLYVAYAYYHGIGVEKDIEKASVFFLKARKYLTLQGGQDLATNNLISKSDQMVIDRVEGLSIDWDNQNFKKLHNDILSQQRKEEASERRRAGKLKTLKAKRKIGRAKLEVVSNQKNASENKGLKQYQDIISALRKNTSEDSNQAITLMKELAGGGEKNALYLMAILSTLPEYTGKLRAPRNAPAIGDPACVDAQYQLGILFRDGLSVEKNILEAVTYLNFASINGHVEANYALGMMYLNGAGDMMPQSAENAKIFFKLAAEKGHAEAAKKLAALEAQ